MAAESPQPRPRPRQSRASLNKFGSRVCNWRFNHEDSNKETYEKIFTQHIDLRARGGHGVRGGKARESAQRLLRSDTRVVSGLQRSVRKVLGSQERTEGQHSTIA